MSAIAVDTLKVMDPRGVGRSDRLGEGAPAGPLAGRRVGLRRDEMWQSWDTVTDVWAALLEADGAEVVNWRAPIVKHGEPAADAGRSFRDFLSSIDIAIVGLCNCGSCTLWAVHDGLAALEHGLPTGFVATEHFERLARVLASEGGREDVRMTVLPYPLEGQPRDVVAEAARANYEQLLQSIGATR